MTTLRAASRPRRATVLLLVLWMLIVLGIIGLSYTSSVRNQLQSAQMTTGKAEAYWAARAGVEKAIGELLAADLTALTDADPLFDDAEIFRDQAAGAARFSLIGRGVNEEGEGRSGIIDEAAFINVNQADEPTLLLFPGMTLELARALFDWRDQDDLPRAYGAEYDFYESEEDGVTPRNAPLQSVRELMRVAGWGGVFQAAYPDPYLAFKAEKGEEDEEEPPMLPEEARFLLESLTAWSSSPAEGPDGREKIDINSADAREMRRRGIRNNEADAIVEQRGKQRFNSLLDLLTVPPPASSSASSSSSSSASNSSSSSSTDSNRGSSRGGGGGRGQSQNSSSGSSASSAPASSTRMFSVRRVGEIIDYFGTVQAQNSRNASSGAAQETPGLVNINTAPHEVLMMLPGMTEELAAAIVQRRAQGAFDRAGAIAQLGIDETTFRRIYPKITARTSRFRVVSRGVSPASGATVTIEAVLAATDEGVETVYWREF